MDTWFWGSKMPIPEQAALLRRLGFAGMTLSWGHEVSERLKALDAAGLDVPGIWVPADIHEPPKFDALLLRQISGRARPFVWLSLTSKKEKKSDSTGDTAATEFVAKLAEECVAAGLPGIALYPHVGFWLEKVEDALRVAKTIGRRNVGIIFNLYHWMATEPGADPAEALKGAQSHLKGVSINGSAARRASILPLGEGDFDVAPLLRALRACRFAGPISHQGFGIQGDSATKLQSARAKWDELLKGL